MARPHIAGNTPGLQCIERPLRIFILVALVAGIGNAQCKCQAGFGDAKAVIVPVVNHHVGFDRHMAIDAGGARSAGFVVVMCRLVEHGTDMALGTQGVVICHDPVAVRIMAVCANDAGPLHLALQE